MGPSGVWRNETSVRIDALTTKGLRPIVWAIIDPADYRRPNRCPDYEGIATEGKFYEFGGLHGWKKLLGSHEMRGGGKLSSVPDAWNNLLDG
ncbi:MAG: hypothetical protein AB1733_24935 [Thermodesulfobacteriota bacterium]